MYLNVYFYIFFSFLIFCIGLIGLILSRRNSFLVLISLEIMFMAVHLNFSYATLFLDDIFGVVIILFILAISGCEISIGLAFFILLYRIKNIALSDKLILIKG